jgi:hypothetical protein
MRIAAEIEEALAVIEQLLAQIEPTRQHCAVMSRNIEEAHRDYEEVVGPANQESIRLETAIAYTRRLLEGTSAGDRLAEPVPLDQPASWITSPPAWDPVPAASDLQDIRAARKRSIADHVLYFAATESDPVVVLMNSLLSKSEHGPGEMLEAIEWGDIWSVAPAWESEQDRLSRLKSWQEELEPRLGYWKARERQLTADYALASRKMKSTAAEWRAYLDGMAAAQKADNARRASELELLRAEWQRRQEAPQA